MPPPERDGQAFSPSASARHEPPGKVEATALAVAGPAFAVSLLILRGATGLAPGMFDAGAAILCGVGLAPWVHRLRGAAAGTATRGLGLLLGTILLSTALVPPFYGAVGPAAIAIVGGTLLQANARRERPKLTHDSLGVACLALAFGLGLLVSGGFPEPERLRLTLVVILGVTVGGLALRRVVIEKGHGALAPMPLGILLVATIGGVYLSYRTLVRAHVANLPLYEWTLAAGAAALLLARLRRRAKEQETSEAWTSVARRHAQDVRPVYDARMGPLAAAVGRYLERGDGYDAYRDVIARAAGGPFSPALSAALEAMPRTSSVRTRAGRREAAARRVALHDEVLARLAQQRGTVHGDVQPGLR